VINLTDSNRTLVINVGNGDTLNLDGFSALSRELNDVNINDGAENSPENRNYDVYTDGNVTLLIHNQGTGTVNFDGAPVAI
jgi:hypothetical protein